MAQVLETNTVLDSSLGVFTLSTEYSGETNPNVQYSVLFTVTDGLLSLEGVSITIDSVAYLTDSNGQVDIFLIRGDYVVDVSLDGYASQTVVFEIIDQNLTENIELVAGGSFGQSYGESYEIEGVAIVPEYALVYDEFTIKPTGDDLINQNNLVSALVDANIWTKLDLFYVLAGHTNDNEESMVNWKTPGNFNAIFTIQPNKPVFVALEGFTGAGAQSYLDTQWASFNDAVNYAISDASYGIYVRTDVDESNPDCGEYFGSSTATFSSRQSNQILYSINHPYPSLLTVSNTDSRGLYVVVRRASTEVDIYKNKNLLDTNSVAAATSLSGTRLYICHDVRAFPPLSSSSTKQISMFFVGSSLNQSEVNNLTDIFEIYMDANGRGVIT